MPETVGDLEILLHQESELPPLTRVGLAHAQFELGILTEITGYSRNRRFRYEPYVRLFSEE